jgi:hypothetical protein
MKYGLRKDSGNLPGMNYGDRKDKPIEEH